MPPLPMPDASLHDSLTQYVSSVRNLHSKLEQIKAKQQDVAASLSRTAALLRSLGAAGLPPPEHGFGQPNSCSREGNSRKS
ncbi:MAG: hypothetical protein H6R15_111 [Proteobacteria bacterium]|nr:hypothetical protein [Pseudomonadota bacterium]